jgi:lipid A 3-O-deacylase
MHINTRRPAAVFLAGAGGLNGGRSMGVGKVWLASLALTIAPLTGRAGLLDEAWVGGLAHDVSDIGQGKESDTADVQIEIDGKSPSFLRFLGAPRPNATLALNSAGRTNSGSLGLTWNHRLVDRLCGSVDFGLSLTDGVTAPPPGPEGAYVASHRLLLGSKVLFREAVGVEWRLSDRWALGPEFVHMSNGLVFARRYNQGINDAGVRLGYRFR